MSAGLACGRPESIALDPRSKAACPARRAPRSTLCYALPVMAALLACSRVVALTALLTAPCGAQGRGGDDIFARRDEWQRVPDIVASLGDVKGNRIADIAAGK